MNKKNGFSLLELIFAIVIIGVIAGVAIPKFMETKDDATAAAIKQDVNTIISSVRSYVLVNGTGDLSDMVSVSSDKWTLNDTDNTIISQDDENCVSFTLSESQLTLEVKTDPAENSVCDKINDSLSSATYDL